MPSRKSEAVSSSQCTESFGDECWACAVGRKLENNNRKTNAKVNGSRQESIGMESLPRARIVTPASALLKRVNRGEDTFLPAAAVIYVCNSRVFALCFILRAARIR